MPTTLESLANDYLRSGSPAQRTREEYATTIKKCSRWNGAVPLEALGKKEIRAFLDWVHEDAASREGSNPGRTTNKVRSHLRAVLSWAWEQDILDTLPQFPRLKPQRDVAGKHYLTKAELNSLYFATHQLSRPRGWNEALHVGSYWRAALVIFFNYGVDTGTVWKSLPFHEPILWRHVSWGLRKTCATYYDEHMPESSIEILGHSAGGITYRHFAHRAPLAFRAILSLPQPSAFKSFAQGFEGQCPCCRRRF